MNQAREIKAFGSRDALQPLCRLLRFGEEDTQLLIEFIFILLQLLFYLINILSDGVERSLIVRSADAGIAHIRQRRR